MEQAHSVIRLDVAEFVRLSPQPERIGILTNVHSNGRRKAQRCRLVRH